MTTIIPIPPGYTDSPESRALLCHQVQQKLGTALQVEAFRNGEIHLAENPLWAPERRSESLSPQLNAQSAAVRDAQVRRTGRSLISYDAAARQAVTAAITPAHRLIRDRIADVLDKKPWEIQCEPRWKDGHLDTVVITQIPTLALGPAARAERFQLLIANLPDGGLGWRVEEDAFSGAVTLTWGEPRSLPKIAPRAELLAAPCTWDRIVVGRAPDGSSVFVDLRNGPQSLVVGPTGSGKTIYLLQHAMSALTGGHKLFVIDPTKGGADFVCIRDYVAGWGDTLEAAYDLVLAAYAEVERRKAILLREGVGFWEDLSPAVAKAEGIGFPLSVIIDEYTSLIMPAGVPKTLPKGHPLLAAAEQENEFKAFITLYVGKMARESRFVGIHLVIATQRADTALLGGGDAKGGGEMRSNMTSRVQLIKPGSVPPQETLGMTFAADEKAAAAEIFAELDDGRSRGLGAVGTDGGRVEGFRVGFAPPTELAEMLDGFGVDKATPWVLRKPKIMQDAEDTDKSNPFD